MVYLTRKVKKGRTYLYLEEKARIRGKVRRTWQIYLGPEDKLKDLSISALLSKKIGSVDISTMNFGLSAALWQVAEQIGLPGIIDKVTRKTRTQNLSLGEYITIAAINRCVAPVTKSKLARWFRKDWLSTRFPIDPDVLNAQTYWNHFQYLNKEIIDKIELAINKVVIDKFDLELNNLLFDPTNFYTFSRGGDASGLRQFGHCKEGRNNLRLVNYSLLCTKDSGIPLMHETYPGNVQDAGQFKTVPERISSRLIALGREPSDFTIVFDKGNHSPEAFKIIDKDGIKFIASARNSMHKDLLTVPAEKMTKIDLPFSGKNVEYYRTKRDIYGHARTVYVVRDPAKHKKHVAMFASKVDNKVREIEDYFKDRLNFKKWRKREAVEKKLKSMIGRKPMAAVVIAKVTGNDGTMTLTVKIDKKARTAHEVTLGRSIIFTNRDGWSPSAVIWSYREQYIVEHAFRHMKCPTVIAIRPMFHHADACIRAHVFICVLALLLLALLRLKLSTKGVAITYDEMIEQLSSIHLNLVYLPGNAEPIKKLEKISGSTANLARVLGLMRLIK